MNELPPRNADVRGLPLPLNVALFGGDITAAIIMQLCGLTLVDAKRSIDAWLTSGALSQPASRHDRPRVPLTARVAAHATSTPRQRRRAHESIARVLDEPDATEAEMLEIARNYRAGAQYRLAIARYVEVAERQLERGERETASAVLAEAGALIPVRGPEMLAVLDLHARTSMALEDLPAAMVVLDRLRRLAATCGDRFATLRALLRCADCSLFSQAPQAAIGYASRAIELGGTYAESSLDSLTATLMLAEAFCEQGRLAQAQARYADAVRLGAEREPSLSPRLHFVAGELRNAARDPSGAAAEFRAASVAADTELDLAWKLKAARALAGTQLQSADLFGCASTLRAALALARSERLPLSIGVLSRDFVQALAAAGRYAQALRLIPAQAPAQAAPLTAAAPFLLLAVQLGDPALIERWSSPHELDDAFAAGSVRRIAAVVPAFAAYERHRSEFGAAEALYRRAIAVLSAIDCTAPAEFWCDAAQHCAKLEFPAVHTALALAGRNALPLAALMIELGSVALAARCANDGTGIDRTEIGARAHSVADALLTAGFKTWSRQARAIAAQTAPRGRARDVIALVGAGRSNAEIAAHLFLSKRTVEKAIGELLRTHGVRSRWQLIGLNPRPQPEKAN